MPARPAQPQPQPAQGDPVLAGRKILVGVTGGIACYKTATLVSRLVQAGAVVRVMMTEAAARFVGPLTFQALSGQSVITSIWQADDRPDSQHVGLARWADLIIIAPASADILAKIAAGLCDDVVSLTVCAAPKQPHSARPARGAAEIQGAGTPVLLAPAMNADMWESPVTQRNVATVTDLLGYQLVGPEIGWQACRTQGPGRMSEPEAILAAARAILAERR